MSVCVAGTWNEAMQEMVPYRAGQHVKYCLQWHCDCNDSVALNALQHPPDPVSRPPSSGVCCRYTPPLQLPPGQPGSAWEQTNKGGWDMIAGTATRWRVASVVPILWWTAPSQKLGFDRMLEATSI
jgi:hypothetical protein